MDWIKCDDDLPPFDTALRVLIYTDGVDFDGEQFFDIRADDLYDHGGGLSEVAEAATHWAHLPFPSSNA